MPSAAAANESIDSGQQAETVRTPSMGTPADSVVAQVTSVLAGIDALALDEHAEAYERVHTGLHAALAEIETA